jgi:hypothetical protein
MHRGTWNVERRPGEQPPNSGGATSTRTRWPASITATPLPTVDETNDLYGRLQHFTSDALKQAPALPAGSRLEQGATYIDLAVPEPTESTATGDMEAQRHQRLVLKCAVDYTLWNRLIGVENRERTATLR